MDRAAPTVATAETPVIDKTITNTYEYDPTDPQTYIDRLNARVMS